MSIYLDADSSRFLLLNRLRALVPLRRASAKQSVEYTIEGVYLDFPRS